MKKSKIQKHQMVLEKTPIGNKGLDEITFGRLPKERLTRIGISAECGKTLFATEFLNHHARQYNESGVLLSFKETEKEHITNEALPGFDLNDLIECKKIYKPRIDLYPGSNIGEQNNAIQMLIKKRPLSLNRVVGDILNTDQVLAGLDLRKINRNEVPISI